jgi:hypothetical protein
MKNPFHIIETFQVVYKKKKLRVDLVDITHIIPEWNFFVHTGKKGLLLDKIICRDMTVWICSGGLTIPEASALGKEIERQWGSELPQSPSDNPFDYQTPVNSIKYTCEVFGMTVTQAKGIYTEDVYYKVTDSGGELCVVKSDFFGTAHWHPIDDENMDESLLETTKGFIEACEKKLAWIAE